MKSRLLQLILCVLLPLAGSGQITPLAINAANHCQYTGDGIPAQFSRMSPMDSVELMVNEILQNTGKADVKNFELIASNVRSVMAVTDAGKRYLLYSRRHFIENTDLTYRYAILAHEIGHHINGHQLTPLRREVEEYEADYYMGYALFRVGRPRNLVATLASRYPAVFSGDSVQRQADILRGYDKAEASILAEPKAGLADDGTGTLLPGIPEMPFPPPLASAAHPLSAYFSTCKYLREVDVKLCRALETAGFYEKGYFYVKDGFSLVTRMEQIRGDGFSLSEANRWNSKPVREEAFSISGYLRAIFTSQPGFFRVFVFIATDEIFVPDKNRKVDSNSISAWSGEGANRLPAAIGNIPFNVQNSHVEAFVYEIEVKEGGSAVYVKKSKLGGKAHLENAKILANLAKK